MSESALRRFILDSFPGTTESEDAGNWFYIYDPDGSLPPERQIPYATLVTSDRYDQASNLDRPNVYRLNISMKKSAFQTLFGTGTIETLLTRYDLTTLDTLMPHPQYGSMWWCCVLNPETTFPAVQDLLKAAYERDSIRRSL